MVSAFETNAAIAQAITAQGADNLLAVNANQPTHRADTEAATAVREHWAIENRLHRVLDVTFAHDQSRFPQGQGARNMATVRRFARDLVRASADKRSIKSRRKLAGWEPEDLQALLSSRPNQLGFEALLVITWAWRVTARVL